MSTELFLSQAFALLDRLGARPLDTMPTGDDINALERQLGARLPDTYRQFLIRYGHLSSKEDHIYGLGTPPSSPPSVLWALFCLRMSSRDVPASLLPIQSLGKRTFACLHVVDGASDAPVVAWQLGVPADQQKLETLYPNFATLLHDLARTLQERLHVKAQNRERWFRVGLERLQWHVQNRQFDWHHVQ